MVEVTDQYQYKEKEAETKMGTASQGTRDLPKMLT